MVIKQEELVDFLKKQTVSATLLQRLKIQYRPLICPFDALLNLIKPGARVLDIGCGAGQFLTLAAEFTDAKALAGIEVSETLISQAQTLLKPYQNQKEIQLKTFDGRNFPGFIKDYDTVFLIDVLHHIPKKHQLTFLTELYQGLSSGATVILKDIDAASPWVYFNKLHDLLLSKEIGDELSKDKASELVQNIGFKISASFDTQMFVYPHYTLILKK